MSALSLPNPLTWVLGRGPRSWCGRCFSYPGATSFLELGVSLGKDNKFHPRGQRRRAPPAPTRWASRGSRIAVQENPSPGTLSLPHSSAYPDTLQAPGPTLNIHHCTLPGTFLSPQLLPPLPGHTASFSLTPELQPFPCHCSPPYHTLGTSWRFQAVGEDEEDEEAGELDSVKALDGCCSCRHGGPHTWRRDSPGPEPAWRRA